MLLLHRWGVVSSYLYYTQRRNQIKITPSQESVFIILFGKGALFLKHLSISYRVLAHILQQNKEGDYVMIPPLIGFGSLNQLGLGCVKQGLCGWISAEIIFSLLFCLLSCLGIFFLL
jgi:hypothetical protein